MSVLDHVSSGTARPAAVRTPRTARVAYFVSHPIQYQAPLLKRIALENDIDLHVYFFSDLSVRGYSDKGFGGISVKWDIPLLDGYAHDFLPSFRQNDTLGFAIPLSYGIFSRLRQESFDAVWVHGYHTINCLHAILAARLLRIPVILRAESQLNDRIRTKTTLLAKRLFFPVLKHLVRCVMPIGKANARYWREYLGSKIPMYPMPYAVDNKYFSSTAADAAPQREALRRELGLQSGRPIFLFASKLQTRKRCADLVDAFLKLSQAPGVDPHAYLLIIGDGEERATIERRIHEFGLSSIRMLGFKNQSELPRFFDLCDVFVLPSIHEPWGLIVNEVMNAARPLVLSDDVGCHTDLVEDGVNGFIFPRQNIDALSAVLRRFLDDPLLAQRMGRQSLKIVDRYSFDECVRGLRQALAFCIPGFAA
ncbi:MAG: glycosyltransferase family 4 protein [Silvibacterium sp.]|jgi:glycosyltransferase involved in cell wall biosynthesis